MLPVRAGRASARLAGTPNTSILRTRSHLSSRWVHKNEPQSIRLTMHQRGTALELGHLTMSIMFILQLSWDVGKESKWLGIKQRRQKTTCKEKSGKVHIYVWCWWWLLYKAKHKIDILLYAAIHNRIRCSFQVNPAEVSNLHVYGLQESIIFVSCTS